ncbi:hypothetical protein [Streptomyces sp. NRRL F-5123]|uniref:hypothetical protein n=1 Tax=Streptomyces sp. NRRL F-5123 TaxID=1463856 RepID=UPI0004E13369|nr:hypothetical protein [Streptomyces sp. NRRL F-5123]
MQHILVGLAGNPALAGESVDRLVRVADDEIAAELACRDDLSRAQAVALAERVQECAVTLAYRGRLTAADVDPVRWPDAALALLDEGAGDPAWARALARDPDRGRREKLAACPGLPADVVAALAADPEVEVVVELALWTALPAVAGELAAHPHAEVRRAAACNEATPPAALAALLTGEGLPAARRCRVCDREEIPFVHDPECPRDDCDLLAGDACDGSHRSTVHRTYEAALRNPATPAEAAARFAGHPSALLRGPLAVRPDLPPDACARLARDPLPGTRSDLAANPALGTDLIRTLAGDPDPDVRRGAARNPRVPLDVLVGLAGRYRVGATLLPRIAACSAAETAELATSADPAARMLVAHRSDLPPALRDRLADDRDARVAKAVAPHPGLSEARLLDMIRRHHVRVLARAATNPDATAAVLDEIARRAVPAARRALREVARHPAAAERALLACVADDRARSVAAGHPSLPPSVVADLLADPDPYVVMAAAANPALPADVMSALLAAC